MADEAKVKLNKGFRDGYFDRTKTSLIIPKPGQLQYRGYNIDDLAKHSTFEETSYLLLHNSLPTGSQLQEFDAQLKANRQLPDEVLQTIRLIRNAHPMDVLRTAISMLSVSDPSVSDISPEALVQKGIRLTSATATIVAAHIRIRDDKDLVAADNDLGHASNFLYMLFGSVPDPQDARLIDKDLLLHAEHGSNASTFAARVAASTRTDIYAAITAAVGVLKGPRHGGAAEAVMQITREIGSEEKAEDYVRNLLQNGGRVPGFGHPVYRDIDPRSVHLKADAQALAVRKGQPQWFSVLEALAETKELKRRARLGVNPNVDLWSGAIYSLLGIPDDLFVPLFAMGRMPGWTAHVMEQYAASDILRPRMLYAGPIDQEYLPIEQRG